MLSVPVGLLAAAILVVNNVRDLETDRRAGKRTLAVRLGRERTRALYAAMVDRRLSCCAPVTWLAGPLSAWLLLCWLTAPLAVPAGAHGPRAHRRPVAQRGAGRDRAAPAGRSACCSPPGVLAQSDEGRASSASSSASPPRAHRLRRAPPRELLVLALTEADGLVGPGRGGSARALRRRPRRRVRAALMAYRPALEAAGPARAPGDCSSAAGARRPAAGAGRRRPRALGSRRPAGRPPVCAAAGVRTRPASVEVNATITADRPARAPPPRRGRRGRAATGASS